jgi:hypothetical protein
VHLVETVDRAARHANLAQRRDPRFGPAMACALLDDRVQFGAPRHTRRVALEAIVLSDVRDSQQFA